MKKIDFKKELSHLYKNSAKKATLVDVPAMQFLMIDGQGNPNESTEYQQAVEALFALSYAIKFHVKKGGMDIDYGVMPLEGLWWVDNMELFDVNKKEDWQWTMMIMQPDFVTSDMVVEMTEQVRKKKDPPALSKLYFEKFEEGKAAQILHIGPFADEGPTIEGLHQFIENEGYQLRDKHHEIYLSDIRRAAPDKWKTIIRQPIRN
jgi:hypothetical protein